MIVPRLCLLGLLVCSPAPAAPVEDPFAANIRPTEALSPAEERAALQVPPGFEVQLVAAEPDIAKPLNLAFDDRGRLWVSDTLEYPFAGPLDGSGRDSIKILENFAADGRAGRVTTFAKGLNLPIGLYPWRGGAIAFSIPHIWRFHDDDGDGRADRREPLYGPFDHTRDTHGLNNGFRRTFDGWLYACHGFNNHSQVRGRDGHAVDLPSGNTYRVRPDGARIEQFTWGQVNPFGMAVDPLGNLFTADCHSKPVYQLLRGGRYPTFADTDDGLGLVPPMMDHLHGSTAICGVAFYAAEHYPPPYRGQLFSGNVMTSRVNRNRIEYHGSTMLAREEPDFVAAADPWFRPVDVVLGPDGALYVADFYNRIIGHYEVELKHPLRDRQRGRIWRIVYKGDDPAARPLAAPTDLTRASAAELVAALASDNLSVRLSATNLLVDAHAASAAEPAARALAESKNPQQRAHALWVLHRIGKLSAKQLAAASRDETPLVRVHAQKVLADRAAWTADDRALAVTALGDAEGFVRRAAADALGLHPQAGQVELLLGALPELPADDVLLRHTFRLALRDQLRVPEILAALDVARLSLDQARTLADVARALPTPQSGDFLLGCLLRHELPRDLLPGYVRHAAQYAAEEGIEPLAAAVRQRSAGDVELQWNLLQALQSGLEQRGAPAHPAARAWAGELVEQLLASAGAPTLSWSSAPLPAAQRGDDPWAVQPRPSADGDAQSLFFCSLPKGEQGAGVYSSQPFPLPEKLSFFVAGHLGPPDRAPLTTNYVRLREADSGALLAEARPPRHDTAQRVEWDLARWRGRQGYLEIVDGDQGDAYAWLAVGRFSLAALNPSQASLRLQAAAELIGRLKLETLRPRAVELLRADSADLATRAALARAIVALAPESRAAALATVVAEPAATAKLRGQAIAAIVERDSKQLDEALAEAMRALPQRAQQTLAEALAADVAGAQSLVQLARWGATSPRMLLRPAVRQRLAALRSEQLERDVAALTERLPSEDEALQKLIDARRAGFGRAQPSPDRAEAIFTKHCAICHQLGGRGAMIGPQLDGIGNRGLERLLEDVLDPNRNVDVAFRTTSLVLEGGTVSSGLLRREEGAQLVLVDTAGKEFRVAKAEVAQQVRSQLSLMPANVAELLTEAEFYDLVAYLLKKRAEPTK